MKLTLYDQDLVIPRRSSPDNPGIDLYLPFDYHLAGQEETRINLQCRVGLPPRHFGWLFVKPSTAQRYKINIANPIVCKSRLQSIAIL